jgi:hypothetical protein
MPALRQSVDNDRLESGDLFVASLKAPLKRGRSCAYLDLFLRHLRQDPGRMR